MKQEGRRKALVCSCCDDDIEIESDVRIGTGSNHKPVIFCSEDCVCRYFTDEDYVHDPDSDDEDDVEMYKELLDTYGTYSESLAQYKERMKKVKK